MPILILFFAMRVLSGPTDDKAARRRLCCVQKS